MKVLSFIPVSYILAVYGNSIGVAFLLIDYVIKMNHYD